MRVIGISAYSSEKQVRLNSAYIRCFERIGFVPVIIPPMEILRTEYTDEREIIARATDLALKLDGLVLTGGTDVNPLTFSEENLYSSGCDIARDTTEINLFEQFRNLGKPVLGICRGFQLMGQAMGLPNFAQDLGETKEGHNGNAFSLGHRAEPMHELMNFGSFAEFLKAKGLHPDEQGVVKTYVNSWHHQGFTLGAKGGQHRVETILAKIEEIKEKTSLEIISTTPAVIEGFAHISEPIVGTQNHPEEYDSSLLLQFFASKFI